MSITRADVADLREGDVVELRFPSGAVVLGPLTEDRHTGVLEIPDVGWPVRGRNGELSLGLERIAESLTVVSRAPRPLYVNHPRTEPVPGDVANWPDPTKGIGPWFYVRESCRDGVWWSKLGKTTGGIPLGQMRLLIDGETGQVVP